MAAMRESITVSVNAASKEEEEKLLLVLLTTKLKQKGNGKKDLAWVCMGLGDSVIEYLPTQLLVIH